MFSNYSKTQILNTMFKGAIYVQPAHLYVGLSTTDPLADFSGLTEVAGNAYARQQCDAWTVAQPNVSNTNVINFPQATGNWGTPRFFFVSDALAAGNYIARGPIVYPNTLVPFGSDEVADAIYAPGNTFVNGDKVIFYGNSLPANLSGNTTYYVVNSNDTGDSFQVSLTSGGAVVAGIGAGHGMVGKDFSQPVIFNNTVSFAAGQLIGTIEG